ncbi:Shedu anti-phage system protein SduA domain-containing protein [Actinomadura sp. NPDC048021]|uniref:Shedu anti-phage system protein SduA domain-containing protein n=1 Tax=Actinomadura sp. NPDC048021 TaxID=3155385 RepID=UPI0033EB7B8A
MGYRAGFTLMQLLKETREMTDNFEIKRNINAAIDFMNSPTSRGHRYRRGQPLVDFLQVGARAAERVGQIAIAERLEDFAEYAAGDIPLTLLETNYIPGIRERDSRYMRHVISAGLSRSIEILKALLKQNEDATGREAYQWLVQMEQDARRLEIGDDRLGGVSLPRGAADNLTWLRRINIRLTEASGKKGGFSSDFIDELYDLEGVELLAQVVELRRRRERLRNLRRIVENPASTELEIHAELKGQGWIFGGRYIEELTRPRLATDVTLDIPLLRGDGALHIVELKQANIPNLLERPRVHPSVGVEVHRAVTQVVNYLRSLDEKRATILADFEIDCRRSFATIVVGHPIFVADKYSKEEVSSAFRAYNSHLARIEVITYQELLDSAERALRVEDLSL